MPSLLLVKTSSLGDIVHALPVLSDLARLRPEWQVHWLVEEAFASLPALHPATHSVIPLALRRWRRAPFAPGHRAEWQALRARLRALQPDRILDLQGLLKSALLTHLASGERHGYDWHSAREPLASLFYDVRHGVSRALHAVPRNRLLAAAALGSDAASDCDYGLAGGRARQPAGTKALLTPAGSADASPGQGSALLLHASSRADKLWPEQHWLSLGQALAARGLICLLPAGGRAEAERAQRLAEGIPGARALPPGPLAELLPSLAQARLAVGVDTGLTHLATAFGLPTVALFTATDPSATGVYGSVNARNLGGTGACPGVGEVLAVLEQLHAC
jgi:heptosyltransferase-1